MCGIVGVVSMDGQSIAASQVHSGVAALRHRGPDAYGVWLDGEIGLGHARLSIIDLSASADQPMRLSHAPVAIVFNGEVYNYRELRGELERSGYEFRTKSDTEVVLAAYTTWGTESFKRLSGMFALAIWDGRTRQLILARDRLGIKPMYFCRTGGKLFFASEPKAIFAMDAEIPRRVDRHALHEFLWFGNALGERTLFRDIKRLLPGTLMKTAFGRDRTEVFWDASDSRISTHDYPQAVTEVRERLRKAVHSHLVSDVPVGVFLSGGIDSSAITAFASEVTGPGLNTYSAAFDFQPENELAHARTIAQRFGTRHEELHVEARDARDLVPRMIRCHDEPFSDAANIPLFLLTQLLDHRVKVILQGDGGDELFAGYQRYEWLRFPAAPWVGLRKATRALFHEHSAARRGTAGRALRVLEALGAPGAKRFALLLTVETEHLPPARVIGPDLRRPLESFDPFERYQQAASLSSGLDPVQQMLRIDLKILLPDTFLEKVDKATMANGIEIRVPFLDNDLTEYALSLPAAYKVRVGEKKRVLRAALRGIVPDSILDRPKTGFGVPYQEWLRKPLRPLLLDAIRARRVVEDGIIDARCVEKLADEHARGFRDHGFLLWKTLNLALWYDMYAVSA